MEHLSVEDSPPKDGAVINKLEDIEQHQSNTSQEDVRQVAEKPKRGWRSYIWDSLDKSPEERKLVFKLDCALLTIGCLGKSNACGSLS